MFIPLLCASPDHFVRICLWPACARIITSIHASIRSISTPSTNNGSVRARLSAGFEQKANSRLALLKLVDQQSRMAAMRRVPLLTLHASLYKMALLLRRITPGYQTNQWDFIRMLVKTDIRFVVPVRCSARISHAA